MYNIYSCNLFCETKEKIKIITPQEKAMATHSSTLAWKIPWAEESGRLQSMGMWIVGHDSVTSPSLSLSCAGEGNGKPLECYCLENPWGGGSFWAAVYGVAQRRTRLKRLSNISSSDHKSEIHENWVWLNRIQNSGRDEGCLRYLHIPSHEALTLWES